MLAFTRARVLDVEAGQLSSPLTVVIDQGRIVSLDPAPPAAEVEQIDLAGATVIPGLIDVHVHLSTGNREAGSGSAVLRQAVSDFIAAGYTTVRDLGSYGTTMFELRTAINEGHLPGPRLILSGQVISVPCPGATAFPGMYRESSGPSQMRMAVREQVTRGADVIKVMVTGALTVPEEDVNPAQIEAAELSALVDEARRYSLPVAAHAEGADGIRLAVAAGVNSIEHGEMGYLVPEVLDEMATRGIVLVPTLCVFDAVAQSPESVFPLWMRERALRLAEAARHTVTAARSAGVAIAAGADAPPHGENARELTLLADAGLTNAEALRAGTSVAARVCGLRDQIGTIEVGKVADLLVLDGDPHADLSTLDPIRLKHVINGGQFVLRHA